MLWGHAEGGGDICLGLARQRSRQVAVVKALKGRWDVELGGGDLLFGLYFFCFCHVPPVMGDL